MSQKKKFQIPHVFVILVMIVIFATAMTYIIPAGEFARVKNEATGKMIVDATSFTWVEQCPVVSLKSELHSESIGGLKSDLDDDFQVRLPSK